MNDPTMLQQRAPAGRAGDVGRLLGEMLAGAGDAAPYRPGRYLETPQRWGILPTLHFWNRRDVWKSARWLRAPVTAAAMVTTVALSVASAAHPWLLPLAGLTCAVPVTLAHGLLERHIRRRLRERAALVQIAPECARDGAD